MRADVINVGGQTMTLGRAVALGLATPDGELTEKGREPNDSATFQRRLAEEAEARWAQKQGLVEKPIEPLRPRNVKDGEPVTDEETLSAIAKKTLAKEAADAKARAAAEVLDDDGA